MLITNEFGIWPAIREAGFSSERISDVVLIGSSASSALEGVRVHSVSAWPVFHTLVELLGLLRRIELELIGRSTPPSEPAEQAATGART